MTAVDDNRELVSDQPGDRLAVFMENGDIKRDRFDPRSKGCACVFFV
jgi:hypothetical protein